MVNLQFSFTISNLIKYLTLRTAIALIISGIAFPLQYQARAQNGESQPKTHDLSETSPSDPAAITNEFLYIAGEELERTGTVNADISDEEKDFALLRGQYRRSLNNGDKISLNETDADRKNISLPTGILERSIVVSAAPNGFEVSYEGASYTHGFKLPDGDELKSYSADSDYLILITEQNRIYALAIAGLDVSLFNNLVPIAALRPQNNEANNIVSIRILMHHPVEIDKSRSAQESKFINSEPHQMYNVEIATPESVERMRNNAKKSEYVPLSEAVSAHADNLIHGDIAVIAYNERSLRQEIVDFIPREEVTSALAYLNGTIELFHQIATQQFDHITPERLSQLAGKVENFKSLFVNTPLRSFAGDVNDEQLALALGAGKQIQSTNGNRERFTEKLWEAAHIERQMHINLAEEMATHAAGKDSYFRKTSRKISAAWRNGVGIFAPKTLQKLQKLISGATKTTAVAATAAAADMFLNNGMALMLIAKYIAASSHAIVNTFPVLGASWYRPILIWSIALQQVFPIVVFMAAYLYTPFTQFGSAAATSVHVGIRNYGRWIVRNPLVHLFNLTKQRGLLNSLRNGVFAWKPLLTRKSLLKLNEKMDIQQAITAISAIAAADTVSKAHNKTPAELLTPVGYNETMSNDEFLELAANDKFIPREHYEKLAALVENTKQLAVTLVEAGYSPTEAMEKVRTNSTDNLEILRFNANIEDILAVKKEIMSIAANVALQNKHILDDMKQIGVRLQDGLRDQAPDLLLRAYMGDQAAFATVTAAAEEKAIQLINDAPVSKTTLAWIKFRKISWPAILKSIGNFQEATARKLENAKVSAYVVGVVVSGFIIDYVGSVFIAALTGSWADLSRKENLHGQEDGFLYTNNMANAENLLQVIGHMGGSAAAMHLTYSKEMSRANNQHDTTSVLSTEEVEEKRVQGFFRESWSYLITTLNLRRLDFFNDAIAFFMNSRLKLLHASFLLGYLPRITLGGQDALTAAMGQLNWMFTSLLAFGWPWFIYYSIQERHEATIAERYATYKSTKAKLAQALQLRDVAGIELELAKMDEIYANGDFKYTEYERLRNNMLDPVQHARDVIQFAQENPPVAARASKLFNNSALVVVMIVTTYLATFLYTDSMSPTMNPFAINWTNWNLFRGMPNGDGAFSLFVKTLSILYLGKIAKSGFDFVVDKLMEAFKEGDRTINLSAEELHVLRSLYDQLPVDASTQQDLDIITKHLTAKESDQTKAQFLNQFNLISKVNAWMNQYAGENKLHIGSSTHNSTENSAMQAADSADSSSPASQATLSEESCEGFFGRSSYDFSGSADGGSDGGGGGD